MDPPPGPHPDVAAWLRAKTGGPCPRCGEPVPVLDYIAVRRSGTVTCADCVPGAVLPAPTWIRRAYRPKRRMPPVWPW